MRHVLTLDELHGVLDYDPDTGIFSWKIQQSNAIKAGAKAGTLKPNGRVYISLFGDAYLAHRLAWFYVKGDWPKGTIRQRDGDLSSARFENLYEASITEVNVGRRLGKNNTSGRVGVTYNKRRKKWRVQIKRDWQTINLGYFDSFEEGCAARASAEEKFSPAGDGAEYERHIEHETMRRRQRVASPWAELANLFAADHH